MEQKRNTHVRQSRYQAKPAPASSRKKAAAPKSARPGGNHHQQEREKASEPGCSTSFYRFHTAKSPQKKTFPSETAG